MRQVFTVIGAVAGAVTAVLTAYSKIRGLNWLPDWRAVGRVFCYVYLAMAFAYWVFAWAAPKQVLGRLYTESRWQYGRSALICALVGVGVFLDRDAAVFRVSRRVGGE